MNYGIWSRSAFNSLVNDPQTQEKVTIWALNSYGKYIWVYLVSPLVAAVLAGIFVRKHFSFLRENNERFSLMAKEN